MVDNPDGVLKAGDYAQVRFDVPSTQATGGGALLLPSSALIFRKQGHGGRRGRAQRPHPSAARDGRPRPRRLDPGDLPASAPTTES